MLRGSNAPRRPPASGHGLPKTGDGKHTDRRFARGMNHPPQKHRSPHPTVSLSPSILALCAVLTAVFSLSGCASSAKNSALQMTEPTLEVRSRSTRRFDTQDEKKILSASAALLQDLGFTLDNSDTRVGLIVASKDRSAVEAGQVAGKIAVGVLLGADVPVDKYQKLRASVVTKPLGSSIAVRVTFQRTVWNDRNAVSRLERIDDPKIYQEFFDKLSKSVFLEAHEI